MTAGAGNTSATLALFARCRPSSYGGAVTLSARLHGSVGEAYTQRTVALCGIDEAGRGPLAGPVTAAAVILGSGFDRDSLADSKMLSALRREAVAKAIVAGDSLWALGWVWPEEIDALNIHHAALRAMSRAFAGLCEKSALPQPLEVVVDGRFCPDLGESVVRSGRQQDRERRQEYVRRGGDEVCEDTMTTERARISVRAQVGGDRQIPEVMAASIVAKVSRDRWMQRYGEWDRRYGFASHKGYPTAGHRGALRNLGACPIHRRTFRGVSHAGNVPSA